MHDEALALKPFLSCCAQVGSHKFIDEKYELTTACTQHMYDDDDVESSDEKIEGSETCKRDSAIRCVLD